jgi:phosphate-selective porin OprO/OprP
MSRSPANTRFNPLALALIAALSGSAAQAADGPSPEAILARLEQLEQRLQALETENKTLKDQLEFRTERLERVENRAARSALPGVAPTYSDVPGTATFKVRGNVQADIVAFSADRGGYDYNSGTGLRRARLGFEGDFARDFKWRLESDFAGNVVGITDAYVSFGGVKPWTFTFGQHKAPYGLESNTSDNFNTFLERGIFNNAFGGPGAERRIGLSAQYSTDTLNIGVGAFGDNESSQRVAAAPDESIGVNGRVTWSPLYEPGHLVHLGTAGYWRTELNSGGVADAVRFSDRPNVRVDGGLFADTGLIRQVDSLSYLGIVAAYVRGPFSVIGEAGRATVNRQGALDDLDFDGYYVYGSWFLTGESRAFRNGSIDRLRPAQDFDWKKGAYGAVELAARWDSFDFSDTPASGARGNQGDTATLALNWYLNPNLKLMFNYIRFRGEFTPLDPVGSRTRGDAFATRLHLDW